MKKKISIIIPVYNSEKYIKDNFKSILNQKYDNIEIIYINDGSIDNSKNILEEIAKKNKFVKVINKKNEGVSSARNEGLKICTGEYITFIDSDDMLDDNCFLNCMNIVEKYNPDIIKFGMKKKYGMVEKKIKRNMINNYMYKNEEYNNLKLKFMNSYDMRNVTGALYKFNNLKGLEFNTNLKMGEDTLLFFKIYQNSKSLYFIDKAYYIYTYNLNSVTHNFDINKNLLLLENVIYVNNYICDVLKIEKKQKYNNIEMENSIKKCAECCNYNTFKRYIYELLNNKNIVSYLAESIEYKKYNVFYFIKEKVKIIPLNMIIKIINFYYSLNKTNKDKELKC